MFCDRLFFTDCKPISGHETVAVGDSCHVPIMGRGTVSFKSKLLGGYRTVILKEVLYVPQLAANLVSPWDFTTEWSHLREHCIRQNLISI